MAKNNKIGRAFITSKELSFDIKGNNSSPRGAGMRHKSKILNGIRSVKLV